MNLLTQKYEKSYLQEQFQNLNFKNLKFKNKKVIEKENFLNLLFHRIASKEKFLTNLLKFTLEFLTIFLIVNLQLEIFINSFFNFYFANFISETENKPLLLTSNKSLPPLTPLNKKMSFFSLFKNKEKDLPISPISPIVNNLEVNSKNNNLALTTTCTLIDIFTIIFNNVFFLTILKLFIYLLSFMQTAFKKITIKDILINTAGLKIKITLIFFLLFIFLKTLIKFYIIIINYYLNLPLILLEEETIRFKLQTEKINIVQKQEQQLSLLLNSITRIKFLIKLYTHRFKLIYRIVRGIFYLYFFSTVIMGANYTVNTTAIPYQSLSKYNFSLRFSSSFPFFFSTLLYLFLLEENFIVLHNKIQYLTKIKSIFFSNKNFQKETTYFIKTILDNATPNSILSSFIQKGSISEEKTQKFKILLQTLFNDKYMLFFKYKYYNYLLNFSLVLKIVLFTVTSFQFFIIYQLKKQFFNFTFKNLFKENNQFYNQPSFYFPDLTPSLILSEANNHSTIEEFTANNSKILKIPIHEVLYQKKIDTLSIFKYQNKYFYNKQNALFKSFFSIKNLLPTLSKILISDSQLQNNYFKKVTTFDNTITNYNTYLPSYPLKTKNNLLKIFSTTIIFNINEENKKRMAELLSKIFLYRTQLIHRFIVTNSNDKNIITLLDHNKKIVKIFTKTFLLKNFIKLYTIKAYTILLKTNFLSKKIIPFTLKALFLLSFIPFRVTLLHQQIKIHFFNFLFNFLKTNLIKKIPKIEKLIDEQNKIPLFLKKKLLNIYPLKKIKNILIYQPIKKVCQLLLILFTNFYLNTFIQSIFLKNKKTIILATYYLIIIKLFIDIMSEEIKYQLLKEKLHFLFFDLLFITKTRDFIIKFKLISLLLTIKSSSFFLNQYFKKSLFLEEIKTSTNLKKLIKNIKQLFIGTSFDFIHRIEEILFIFNSEEFKHDNLHFKTLNKQLFKEMNNFQKKITKKKILSYKLLNNLTIIFFLLLSFIIILNFNDYPASVINVKTIFFIVLNSINLSYIFYLKYLNNFQITNKKQETLWFFCLKNILLKNILVILFELFTYKIFIIFFLLILFFLLKKKYDNKHLIFLALQGVLFFLYTRITQFSVIENLYTKIIFFSNQNIILEYFHFLSTIFLNN